MSKVGRSKRRLSMPASFQPIGAKRKKSFGLLTVKYARICCIYFEWPLGAQSTDHFGAKSSHAGQAYEWNNFRLSCLGANRNKNRFDDVLDPFGNRIGDLHLEFRLGRNQSQFSLLEDVRLTADQTIRRLKLDAPECNRMRAEHYEFYVQGLKFRHPSPILPAGISAVASDDHNADGIPSADWRWANVPTPQTLVVPGTATRIGPELRVKSSRTEVR
ncbi:MAG: hypothetical protein IPK44_16310 [Candidatus Accumulibacter sp.]|uniref:hypothetical protein n=1 Tax=Accumulibacter sp. TaxID=2053492 RepID=UPI00258F883C|nr:hypothetical protein [Accumulibacter sp.]MBK8115937.1 hypothetical protein [Accumulibacter sp.]